MTPLSSWEPLRRLSGPRALRRIKLRPIAGESVASGRSVSSIASAVHQARSQSPRKRERAIMALNVVQHIEGEASLIATIPRASQTPSDHLEVKIRAIYGSGHNDGTYLLGVEDFVEYAIVHQHPDLAAPKPFDDAATRCGLRSSAYGARRYSLAVEEAAAVCACSTGVAKISVGQCGSVCASCASMMPRSLCALCDAFSTLCGSQGSSDALTSSSNRRSRTTDSQGPADSR